MPLWLPGVVPLVVWLVTRGVLLAYIGGFYPWEWFTDLIYLWVGTMTAGGDPYAAEQAYPPLAMLIFLIPAAFAKTPEAFRTVYPLFILVIDFALLLWMRRAERDGFRHAPLAYALAVPAIGTNLLLWRFDLIPALCQTAATVCAVRGARRWSWAWLGIGVAVKLYLLALLPLWIAWELYSHRHSRLLARGLAVGRGVAFAIGPVAVLAGAAFLVWGPRSIEPYTYSFGRGVTIDSTPATIIAELGRAGVPTRWFYEDQCFCPVRSAGPEIDGPLRTHFSLIGIAGSLAFVVWYLWSPSGVRLAAAAAGITAVLVFASPILSPQHLVWPLVALALIAFDPRGLIALGMAAVAALTAAYLMAGPTFQVHLFVYDDLGRALMLLRVFASLGTVLALVVPIGRGFATTRSEDPALLVRA